MQIRFKTGPNKGKSVVVSGAAPILIGRESHCGLQIIDRGVSREHARIVRVGEMVFLHDLGSRNGSYVNGERVKEELLREGDTIRVGATQLIFESAKTERRDGIQYDEIHRDDERDQDNHDIRNGALEHQARRDSVFVHAAPSWSSRFRVLRVQPLISDLTKARRLRGARSSINHIG